MFKGTTKPTLILLRGLPGSGKSSFAGFIAGTIASYAAKVEADDYFIDEYGNYNFDASKLKEAHAACQEKCRSLLNNYFDVIVSNTSTTEKEVETYQKIAQECNANFVSLIVENRHAGTSIHNVPAEKIQQMRNRFSVKL